ncbi:unnamed protein product [Spirodela intermedia]|uniref:Dof-type domain-containing protein n=1 Tax=Spirodela intermedia TaxID=51605 RepID=A0A7I8KY47_SPIIN|nr:unnamed protein product [Spirodela intermedia]
MAGSWGLVKLFGKTIPVPVEVHIQADPFKETGGGSGAGGERREAEDEDDGRKHLSVLAVESSGSASEGKNEQRSPSSPVRSLSGGGEKNPKPAKPEKILPCPRCNSMATKFCYYNNYNLNQPRHFCKNCQRYWTAGGTMRNVPVGAGRRKNKHSAAYCRHITVVKAPLSPEEHAPVFPAEEKSNSAGGDGWGENAPCFSGNPWAYPISVYPMAAYWSVPWMSPSSSPGLGKKHPRQGEAEPERCLWFPKTLRIDDPVEAAKSSIWAAMGLSKDMAGRGGLFTGFDQAKDNPSATKAEASKAFLANPAAVSRSFSFQESSLFD